MAPSNPSPNPLTDDRIGRSAVPAYMETEESLSAGLGRTIAAPIRYFTLAGLGLDSDLLLEFLQPTFAELPWDYYDVRRHQIDLLLGGTFSNDIPIRENYLQYYEGTIPLDSLLLELAPDSMELREKLLAVQPFRRRTVANFELRSSARKGWRVSRVPLIPIAQNVSGTDIRAIPRRFAEASERVTDFLEFRRLLIAIAEMVKEVSPKADRVDVTFWHSQLVAAPGRKGFGAPEGVHQDGADYIVSAVVIERHNVSGGTSRVYGPDKTSTYFSHTLVPGEGIFQADAGSPLWHDVTPIEVQSPTRGPGYRSTLGFDLYIR